MSNPVTVADRAQQSAGWFYIQIFPSKCIASQGKRTQPCYLIHSCRRLIHTHLNYFVQKQTQ